MTTPPPLYKQDITWTMFRHAMSAIALGVITTGVIAMFATLLALREDVAIMKATLAKLDGVNTDVTMMKTSLGELRGLGADVDLINKDVAVIKARLGYIDAKIDRRRP